MKLTVLEVVVAFGDPRGGALICGVDAAVRKVEQLPGEIAAVERGIVVIVENADSNAEGPAVRVDQLSEAWLTKQGIAMVISQHKNSVPSSLLINSSRTDKPYHIKNVIKIAQCSAGGFFARQGLGNSCDGRWRLTR